MPKKVDDSRLSLADQGRSILKDLQRISAKMGHTPSLMEYLERGKYSERQLQKYGAFRALIEKAGLPPRTKNEQLDLRVRLKEAKSETDLLRKLLLEAEQKVVDARSLKAMIGAVNAAEFRTVAQFMKPAKVAKDFMGMPNLFLSDIHFDEVVKPEQIQHCNEYNREIAVRRLKHSFQTSVDILKGVFRGQKYGGFCLHLGGDLLSGNIHEELAETNEDTILRSCLYLTDLLLPFIDYLITEFGFVFITGVTGNHGRIHRKPRAKNRAYENYEWIIYQTLVRHYKDDSRVKFLIPDGSDAQFQIYGMNFLLTHGDQFSGGAGISGLMAPLMLGLHRKQKRQTQIHRPFDIMMMGHWHQLIQTDSLIINGSVKGYDEYAYQMNLPFERPQQALFIVHPEHGITFRAPVICDSYEKRSKADMPKIVVPA